MRRRGPNRCWAIAAALLLAGCGGNALPKQPHATGPALSEADQALCDRGVGLLGQFAFEDAEPIFADLSKRNPSDREVKLNWAIAILNQTSEGAQERAIALLDELIASDPDDARAHYCAGLGQLFLGRPEAALPLFEVAAKAEPDDAYAVFYVGQCLEYAGHLEEALAAYRRAAALDPYLRSPLLRQQAVLRKLGKEEESDQALAAFVALDGNPRARIAEFRYTRMGPLSEAVTRTRTQPAAEPTGPFFAAAPIVVEPTPPWRSDGAAPSISVADIDGDGALDLFLASALADERSAVLLAVPDSAGRRYRFVADHPLAAAREVRAALWGDIDNDGHLDAYLCRRGPNQLWLGGKDGSWRDATATSGTAGGEADTVDGAMADLDHDGDLDLYLVNGDAPCELLSNNLDGTFRAIGKDSGATGDGRPARQVMLADVDGDRDVDVLLVHREPPNELLLNDRLWRYRPDPGAPFREERLAAVAAADSDADGRLEIAALGQDGGVSLVARTAGGWGARRALASGAVALPAGTSLAWLDVAGSGVPALLTNAKDALVARRPDGSELERLPALGGSGGGVGSWTPTVVGGRGPSLVLWNGSGLALLDATDSRGRFVTANFSGRIDPSQSMRSNASGIGTRVTLRHGGEWSIRDTFRSTSGPGQSLLPLAIGVRGGGAGADFVAIDWSDGVFQTELALEAGRPQRIVETQRQISSCPLLFAWDGERHRFVTDCLGVGGLGYLVGMRQGTDGRLGPDYAPPRPWERLLLPADLALVPRDGMFDLRLGEPMEEALYLDAARLVAYDLPPEWSLTIDERMGLAEPQPSGEVRAYRAASHPSRAVDARGHDVLPAVASTDGIAAPIPERDGRFIGRLAEPQSITLEFERPLDQLPGTPTLVASGWIEYPYCQTIFAAWQAGAAFDAPTLEARREDGTWQVIAPSWGYPAGMQREMSLPLAGLPAGTKALRLSTNQEIHWDALFIAGVEPCPPTVRTELPLRSAVLLESGFPIRVSGDGARPDYDYARRPPFWATRHQPGFYTAFGPCEPLLAATDDALAVLGPGEEVRLRFAADIAPPRAGWTRRYVLEVDGWCKDMDLFTGDGERLEPLPSRAPAGAPASSTTLNASTRTRWRGGY